MVIIEAKVILRNIYNSELPYVFSDVRLSIDFGIGTFTSMLETKKGQDIYFDEETEVYVTIPCGECSLENIFVGKKFEMFRGRKVGEGVIMSVKEVYVELDSLKLIKDIQERKKIIELAENMENAIVYEDVYLLIKVT